MVHQAKSLVFLLVFVINRALSSPVGKPCDNVVCENDGTCQSEGSSYICKCADGYSGDHCETQEPNNKRIIQDMETIACRGKRCGGGGGGGSYNPCLGVTCYNGGYCTSGKCICPGGTSGTTCLTVDKCYGITCYYGVCSGGTCICSAGYTGSTCLSKIINGGWSAYSASSGCSANCGGGSMSYYRSCNNPAPANGGATCSGSSTKSESCNTHSCPVNGGWSGWSVSSSCTAACGGGSISYKRSCTNPSPAHGGAFCSGSDSKSESCNTHSCPVNGGWSGWSVSSGCTAACGGGSISYKRSCNNPSPAHGGATCSGSDSKSESCNTHSCPVNGGWSGWSVSSVCTAACGGGSISYKRSCNNPSPAHGGATCSGSDSKSESCNTHSCPVNGGWSSWSASSSCTAACGGGSISYKRSCTNPSPAHGGVYCSGSDTKSESCNTHSCPVNGGWSDWTATSSCTATCGGGSISYSRTCNNPTPAHGGSDCSGSTTTLEKCNTHACPINGGWSGWTTSSSCTAVCGGGTISYKRSCTNPSPAHGGATCSGSDSKSESCNTHSCPVNGGWSGWSTSSSCTAACGGGSISYKRTCTSPSPAHGGATCSGSDTKSESCNTHSCPVNGGWSDWTATSSCTATCGGGSISYSRTCNNPTPAHGGSDCSGSTTLLEKCNTHACPINGGWSGWTTSSSCTAVCGGGTISYKRSCTNPSPAHGGATCSGSDTKSESCNTHSCPVNGGWSGWSTSSSCTAACGGGSISYKRSCTNPSPAHGGATCSGSDTKSESCNTHSCPVNGGWSDWTATSSCTATCGGGSISYSRTCNNPIPAHGGSDCSGSTTTLEKCNTHACPINGGWSGWTTSSSCTAVCGGGTISYKRSCTNPSPAHGGATCSGSDTKSESCNTHSCPVNGGWSGWSTSSSCTAACGGGSISYKRTCTNPSPAHGGATCSGSDTKSESCNTHSCPVNGGWSDWTATSSCTATCGGGSISYSRTCNNPTPAHGGSDCSGSRTTLEKCNTHACPINGGWSGWSVSSDCTATCGGGSISYKRTCTNPAPAYEGVYCSGEDTKSESCNTHNCPVNGGWSGWSTSSSCSATCGGGSISYKRTCTNPAPAYLGAYCSGSDIKSESCNTHNCPVNGEWSDWTASGCTAACGGGSMSYSRTCNNPAPDHGGDDCSGSRTKSEPCNTQSCPVNGGWSDWTSWAACSLDCGGGTQRKTRTCTKPAPTHDGLDCGGDSSVSQSCNTHLCPINGGWSGWSATSGCTVACGGGSISYKRSCTNPAPAHGGATCSGSDSKSESCNTHNCPGRRCISMQR
ncbi:SCO-spondin-like [Mytilus edulis]|uniref:SCO-spondin-like n=1 Tax=Mytilus edulis TaxID=6550 RepID=UPI0039F0C4E3